MFPLGVLKKQKPAPDPNLTLLLMHFEGANGSTTFTDSSPVPYAIINTDAQISSFTLKSGFGSSGFFNNSGGSPYRKIESVDVAPDLRNTDFTIECFIHPTALNFTRCEIFGTQRANSDLCYACHISQTTNELTAIIFGTEISHQTTISLDTTYHIALVRHNNNFILYLNGVASNTTPSIPQPIIDDYNPANPLMIGVAIAGSASFFTGYIDEFRIRKEAVYTGNFTPPTAPFSY
jgi:hypothetical protein